MASVGIEDRYFQEASRWTSFLGPQVHAIDDIAHRKLRNTARICYSKSLFFTAVAISITTVAILLSKFTFCLIALPVALLAIKFFFDARNVETKDLQNWKLMQSVHFRRELQALNLPALPSEGASPADILELVRSHQAIIQPFLSRWGRAFPHNLQVFTDALADIEFQPPSEQLRRLQACHIAV